MQTINASELFKNKANGLICHSMAKDRCGVWRLVAIIREGTRIVRRYV